MATFRSFARLSFSRAPPLRVSRCSSSSSSAAAAASVEAPLEALNLLDDKESTSLTALKPSQVVTKLDDYIVGQADAKRAVAIALRNRWRRHHLPEIFRNEVCVAQASAPLQALPHPARVLLFERDSSSPPLLLPLRVHLLSRLLL